MHLELLKNCNNEKEKKKCLGRQEISTRKGLITISNRDKTFN